VPVLSFRPSRRTEQPGSPKGQQTRPSETRRRQPLFDNAPQAATAAPEPDLGSPTRVGPKGEGRPGQQGSSRRNNRQRTLPSFPDAFAPTPLNRYGGGTDWKANGPGSPSASTLPGATARRKPVGLAVFGTDGHLLAVTQERRELVCSLIGLTVKLGLVAVTGLSLVRIAGAYQHRMDSNGEIVAVLELEKARLSRARERFDALFMVEGEQRLIREQSQWIAPNRLRVIWQSAETSPKPSPKTGAAALPLP